MKRILSLYCIAAVVLISCGKNNTEPAVPPEDPEEEGTDLSRGGTSNCYLISAPEGRYFFRADVKGNGKAVAGLSGSTSLDPASAGLVWQSSRDMIKDVRYRNGNISFEWNSEVRAGNALIAALDKTGKIIWSWHIWAPEDEAETSLTKTGYMLMNMNVGAMKSSMGDGAATYGMLYQWGRKDPFPASPSETGDEHTVGAVMYGPDGEEVLILHSDWYSAEANSIEYGIANPTVCLSNYAQYTSCRDWIKKGRGSDALWGNPEGNERDRDNGFPNKGEKTIYDPCPQGYRVPPADVFRSFTSSGGFVTDMAECDIDDADGDGTVDAGDYGYGWLFRMEEGSQYFPAAARYDGSYAMLMGSKSGLWGTYWSNSPGENRLSDASGFGYVALAFSKEDPAVSTSAAAVSGKADAYSVRCIKE